MSESLLFPVAPSSTGPSVGDLLRAWRQRRRRSQLDLALEAGISQRHLSFLESGRSSPSREMVLKLAQHLAVPFREQNRLLVAAGFAPVHGERSLDDPALHVAIGAVRQILKGYEPHPAIAVDRYWTMVFANAAIEPFLAGVDPELLQPPVNALRLSLHPKGLAARILNFREWRDHILARLAEQVEVSADPKLIDLIDELKAYPDPSAGRDAGETDTSVFGGVAVPLKLASEAGPLDFLTTTTVFGTALDVTLSELAIEAFFPANDFTAEAFRRLLEGRL
ncbi:helix-turn-helix domain-containing protein [Roseibium aggregatum]|uniref:Helix-turn-helix transcriptional regulator n=1 Tax=Roseibium aggregatum TaxID=187304 RepID=A0A939EE32_9HYPH|nr:helix-turn-helix domain-containing protein [Roseibium aggregatum]MBN9671268.1 helix-turn-helix transcriptional regulator [Roseibium aggregatum]